MCEERHTDCGLPSVNSQKSQKKTEPHLKSHRKSLKRNLAFHTKLRAPAIFRQVFMGLQLSSLNDCKLSETRDFILTCTEPPEP